ncbi:MAG: YggU family protein [Gammaproteobacteria bacterium]|nr:YggU family protein [Gammaproteobacteria bacterium]
MADFYHWQGQNLIIDCHLQPGARGIGFAGLHGERLKIRISAPPVDGKANAMLLEFLARAFAVSKRQVSLLSGQQSRQKRVLIEAPQQLPEELGINPA